MKTDKKVHRKCIFPRQKISTHISNRSGSSGNMAPHLSHSQVSLDVCSHVGGGGPVVVARQEIVWSLESTNVTIFLVRI